jgi:hypothetical protein
MDLYSTDLPPCIEPNEVRERAESEPALIPRGGLGVRLPADVDRLHRSAQEEADETLSSDVCDRAISRAEAAATDATFERIPWSKFSKVRHQRLVFVAFRGYYRDYS